MKIAIPVFRTKVSPRFDSSQSFILLDILNGQIVDRVEISTRGWPTAARIDELLNRGIDLLICGGIDRDAMRRLRLKGIRVYSWITGEVDDAVASFLSRTLESGLIIGARGARNDRWRFRGDREQDLF